MLPALINCRWLYVALLLAGASLPAAAGTTSDSDAPARPSRPVVSPHTVRLASALAPLPLKFGSNYGPAARAAGPTITAAGGFSFLRTYRTTPFAGQGEMVYAAAGLSPVPWGMAHLLLHQRYPGARTPGEPAVGVFDTVFRYSQLQELTFRAIYRDPTNQPPYQVAVIINGNAVPMAKENPADTDFAAGVTYVAQQRLPSTPPVFPANSFTAGVPDRGFHASDTVHVFSFQADKTSDGRSRATCAGGWLNVNIPPRLENPAVVGMAGSGSSGPLWTFHVRYVDNNLPNNPFFDTPSGDPPAYVRVVVDGVSHDMVTPGNDVDYNEYGWRNLMKPSWNVSPNWPINHGVQFIYTTPLSAGAHTYHFEASDGWDAVATADAAGPHITLGVPAQLAFVTVPANTTAGTRFSPAIQVAVQDAGGNTLSRATNTVTLSLGTGPTGAQLLGAGTVSASGGVARFPLARIGRAGSGYRLLATSPGLLPATSPDFDILPAAPVKLAFVVHPSSGTAGSALSPAVKVAIQDAMGNTVTTATHRIAIAVAAGPAGATLWGTTNVLPVAGVATFANLKFPKAGTYYLRASTEGLAGATSTALTLTAGHPAKMLFSRQPSNATAGAVMPAVQVTLQDALGNPCRMATNAVTLALTANPKGAVLTGTTTVNAVRGVATFTGLRTDKAGTGYTLSATSSGLPPETSSSFGLTAGRPARLAFTVQPTPSTAGAVTTPPVKVAVYDRVGNLCTTATHAVTVVLTGPEGDLSGTTTRSAVAGLATFDDLVVRRGAGTGTYRLLATASGLAGALSRTFVVTGSAAPPTP